jgi:hypothetical protein
MLIEKAERVVYGHPKRDMQANSPPPDTAAEFLDTVPPEEPHGTLAAIAADAQPE